MRNAYSPQLVQAEQLIWQGLYGTVYTGLESGGDCCVGTVDTNHPLHFVLYWQEMSGTVDTSHTKHFESDNAQQTLAHQ